MYKKSRTAKTPSLFRGVTQHMDDRKLRDLSEENAWYNVFFREITSGVDENVFKPLYSSINGRPNASIRILVSMIIMKEGHNWTDEQLYENCRYNIAVMRALGLTNISDEVPVASTYYDFKSRLVAHHKETGQNLFESLFQSITSKQIKKYNVSGRSIRMDSKLIQSNIRIGSQLHKVLQATQVFQKSLCDGCEKKIRKKNDREFIEQIMSKSVTNHLYGMTGDEKSEWLRKLGFLLRKMVNIYKDADSKYYQQICQIYKEHYTETGDKDQPSRPKDKDEMKAGGLQSMHDPDATYRTKGRGTNRQQVSGYSSNITETTEGELRLITDVQVENATQSDSNYLELAAKNTAQLTAQQIEQVHTDGGYDSIENRLRFSEHIGDEWHLAKCIGGKGYEFETREDGTILIYSPYSKKWQKATMSRGGRYRIRLNNRSTKYRYFKKEQVEAGIALRRVRPEKIDKGIRANAESTINQVFHTLKAGKSKYRGLLKHKIFVTARSLWVNSKRIAAIDFQNTLFLSILTYVHHRISQTTCKLYINF